MLLYVSVKEPACWYPVDVGLIDRDSISLNIFEGNLMPFYMLNRGPIQVPFSHYATTGVELIGHIFIFIFYYVVAIIGYKRLKRGMIIGIEAISLASSFID